MKEISKEKYFSRGKMRGWYLSEGVPGIYVPSFHREDGPQFYEKGGSKFKWYLYGKCYRI